MSADPRLPWFPCYPSKLLGALSAMSTDEGYVYVIVCLRIYETGKPCPDTIEALARRSGMNRRRAADALDRLFRSGKLVREGDRIMNPFAAEVLAETQAMRERRSIAGRKAASAAHEKTKENQIPEGSNRRAIAGQSQTHLHLQGTEVDKKEDKRVRATARHALPGDWELTDADKSFAAQNGFSPGQFVRMADAFRDHHHHKKTMGVKWDAAWRTWVRNELKFSSRNGAKNDGRGNPTMAAFDDLLARTDGGAGEGFPSMRDVTPRSSSGR